MTINGDNTAILKIDDTCAGNLGIYNGKIAITQDELYFTYNECGYTTETKTYSECNKIIQNFYYTYENEQLNINGFKKQ